MAGHLLHALQQATTTFVAGVEDPTRGPVLTMNCQTFLTELSSGEHGNRGKTHNRLSWLSVLGFDLDMPAPDENTFLHPNAWRVMKTLDQQLLRRDNVQM